jgi:hypothetical protein
MAKPSNLIRWATGVGTTLEPTEDEKTAGFVALQKPPARWHNWLWNGAYQWFSYLNNLHNETQFLNKTYPWTGAHAFSGSVGIFSTAVIGGTTNELEYADSAGVVTPRSRTVNIPLITGMPYSTTAAELQMTGSGAMWSVDGSGGTILLPLKLPHGAIVTDILGVWRNDGGGATTYGLALIRSTPDFASGTVPTLSTLGSGASGSIASGGTWIGPGAITPTAAVNNALYEYALQATAGAEGDLAGVRVTYLDPGPRNH